MRALVGVTVRGAMKRDRGVVVDADVAGLTGMKCSAFRGLTEGDALCALVPLFSGVCKGVAGIMFQI